MFPHGELPDILIPNNDALMNAIHKIIGLTPCRRQERQKVSFLHLMVTVTWLLHPQLQRLFGYLIYY